MDAGYTELSFTRFSQHGPNPVLLAFEDEVLEALRGTNVSYQPAVQRSTPSHFKTDPTVNDKTYGKSELVAQIQKRRVESAEKHQQRNNGVATNVMNGWELSHGSQHSAPSLAFGTAVGASCTISRRVKSTDQPSSEGRDKHGHQHHSQQAAFECRWSNALAEVLNKYSHKLLSQNYCQRVVAIGHALFDQKHYGAAVTLCYSRLAIKSYIKPHPRSRSSSASRHLLSEGSESQIRNDSERMESESKGKQSDTSSTDLDALCGGSELVQPVVECTTGYLRCQYELLMLKDPTYQNPETREIALQLLESWQAVGQPLVSRYSLCWIAYNVIVNIYKISQDMMTRGFTAEVLPSLLWCSLFMKHCVPLRLVRYVRLRTQITLSVCHGYIALRYPLRTEAIAQEALKEIQWVVEMEKNAGRQQAVASAMTDLSTACIQLNMMLFRRTAFSSRKKQRGVFRQKPCTTMKEFEKQLWPRNKTERHLIQSIPWGKGAQLLTLLLVMDDPQRRTLHSFRPEIMFYMQDKWDRDETFDGGRESRQGQGDNAALQRQPNDVSLQTGSGSDVDTSLLMDIWHELFYAAAEIVAMSMQTNTCLGENTCTWLDGSRRVSQLDMAIDKDACDVITSESAVRLVKFCYCYEMWESLDYLMTPMLECLSKSESTADLAYCKQLEIISAVRCIQGQLDSAIQQSLLRRVAFVKSTSSAEINLLNPPKKPLSGEKLEALGYLASVLDSCLLEPLKSCKDLDNDLVNDALLLLWACAHAFYSQITQMSQCTHVLEDDDLALWLHIGHTMVQGMDAFGLARHDHNLFCEVSVKLALLIDTIAGAGHDGMQQNPPLGLADLLTEIAVPAAATPEISLKTTHRRPASLLLRFPEVVTLRHQSQLRMSGTGARSIVTQTSQHSGTRAGTRTGTRAGTQAGTRGSGPSVRPGTRMLLSGKQSAQSSSAAGSRATSRSGNVSHTDSASRSGTGRQLESVPEGDNAENRQHADVDKGSDQATLDNATLSESAPPTTTTTTDTSQQSSTAQLTDSASRAGTESHSGQASRSRNVSRTGNASRSKIASRSGNLSQASSSSRLAGAPSTREGNAKPRPTSSTAATSQGTRADVRHPGQPAGSANSQQAPEEEDDDSDSPEPEIQEDALSLSAAGGGKAKTARTVPPSIHTTPGQHVRLPEIKSTSITTQPAEPSTRLAKDSSGALVPVDNRTRSVVRQQSADSRPFSSAEALSGSAMSASSTRRSSAAGTSVTFLDVATRSSSRSTSRGALSRMDSQSVVPFGSSTSVLTTISEERSDSSKTGSRASPPTAGDEATRAVSVPVPVKFPPTLVMLRFAETLLQRVLHILNTVGSLDSCHRLTSADGVFMVTDPHLFLVSTVATFAQSWSADTKQMQRLWPRHYSNIVVPCACQASKAAHCARHPTDTRKQEETGVLHLDVLFAMYRIKIKTALVAARDKGSDMVAAVRLACDQLMLIIRQNRVWKAIMLTAAALELQLAVQEHTNTDVDVKCLGHVSDMMKDACQIVIQAADDEPNVLSARAQAVHISPHVGLKTPPPPLLVSFHNGAATLRPQPFHPKSNQVVASYRVFACQAIGQRLKARLDDYRLPGLGIDVLASETARFTVRNLKHNQKYVFAMAAYDTDGNLIGDSVGESTKPILMSDPLPLVPLTGILCKSAVTCGMPGIVKKSAELMWNVCTEGDRLRCFVLSLHPIFLQHFAHSVMARIRLDIQEMDESYPHVRVCLLGIPLELQAEHIALCNQLLLILDVATFINDGELALQIVLMVFSTLVREIELRIASKDMLRIMLKCHAAIQELLVAAKSNDTLRKALHSEPEVLLMTASVAAYIDMCYTVLLKSEDQDQLDDDGLKLTSPVVREALEYLSVATGYVLQPSVAAMTNQQATGNRLGAATGAAASMNKSMVKRAMSVGQLKTTAVSLANPAVLAAIRALQETHSYLSAVKVPSDGKLAPIGIDDRAQLHGVIRQFPSEIAYREVNRCRKRAHFLEFFVRVVERSLERKEYALAIENSEQAFAWLARRNYTLLRKDKLDGDTKLLNKLREAIPGKARTTGVVNSDSESSGDSSSSSSTDQPEDPENGDADSPTANERRDNNDEEDEESEDDEEDKEEDEEEEEEESSRGRLEDDDNDDERMGRAFRKRKKANLFRQVKPERISRPTWRVGAKAIPDGFPIENKQVLAALVLHARLPCMWRMMRCRKRFLSVSKDELPWRSRLHYLLAKVHFSLYVEELQKKLSAVDSIPETFDKCRVHPSWFDLGIAGGLVVNGGSYGSVPDTVNAEFLHLLDDEDKRTIFQTSIVDRGEHFKRQDGSVAPKQLSSSAEHKDEAHAGTARKVTGRKATTTVEPLGGKDRGNKPSVAAPAAGDKSLGSDSPGDLTLVKASTEDDENEDVSDSATRGSDETESGDRNSIVNGGSVLNDTVDNNAKADVNTEAGHAHDTEESDTTETDTTGMDTGSDTEVEDGETLEDTGIKDGAHNSMDQTGTAEGDGSTASRGRTKGKKHHKKKKKKKKKGHSKKKGHVDPEDGSRRQRSSSSTAITADGMPDDDDDDSDFDDEAISNECAATESPDEITVTLTSAGDFTGANSKLDEYRSMLTPDKLIRSDQLDAVKSHLTRALVCAERGKAYLLLQDVARLVDNMVHKIQAMLLSVSHSLVWHTISQINLQQAIKTREEFQNTVRHYEEKCRVALHEQFRKVFFHAANGVVDMLSEISTLQPEAFDGLLKEPKPLSGPRASTKPLPPHTNCNASTGKMRKAPEKRTCERCFPSVPPVERDMRRGMPLQSSLYFRRGTMDDTVTYTLDLRWCVNFTLATLQKFFFLSRWELVIDFGQRFNAATSNACSLHVTPLLFVSQRKLDARLYGAWEVAENLAGDSKFPRIVTTPDLLPSVHADPVGEQVYDHVRWRTSATLAVDEHLTGLREAGLAIRDDAHMLYHSRLLRLRYIGSCHKAEGIVSTPVLVETKVTECPHCRQFPAESELWTSHSVYPVLEEHRKDALTMVVSHYMTTIKLLKTNEDKTLMYQARAELAGLFFHAKHTESAYKIWQQLLCDMLGVRDVLHDWRQYMDQDEDEEPDDAEKHKRGEEEEKSAEGEEDGNEQDADEEHSVLPGTMSSGLRHVANHFLETCGVWGCLFAGQIATKLARFEHGKALKNQTECCLLAFSLFKGAMQASLPLSWMDDMKFAEHTVDPSRLLPGVELFSDPYRCDAVALSHDLVWLCRTLIDAGYLNQSLPMLSLLKGLARNMTRSLEMSVDAMCMQVAVLSQLGVFSKAATCLRNLLTGHRMPDGIGHVNVNEASQKSPLMTVAFLDSKPARHSVNCKTLLFLSSWSQHREMGLYGRSLVDKIDFCVANFLTEVVSTMPLCCPKGEDVNCAKRLNEESRAMLSKELEPNLSTTALAPSDPDILSFATPAGLKLVLIEKAAFLLETIHNVAVAGTPGDKGPIFSDSGRALDNKGKSKQLAYRLQAVDAEIIVRCRLDLCRLSLCQLHHLEAAQHAQHALHAMSIFEQPDRDDSSSSVLFDRSVTCSHIGARLWLQARILLLTALGHVAPVTTPVLEQMKLFGQPSEICALGISEAVAMMAPVETAVFHLFTAVHKLRAGHRREDTLPELLGAVTQLIEQPEPQSHTAVSSLGRWLPFVAGTVRSVLCANRKLVHGLTARLGSPVSMLLQVGKQAYRELMYTTGQWNGTGALPAIGPTPLACNVNSPHVMSLVECRLHPSVMALVDRTLAVGRVQRSLSYVAPLKEATQLPMKVVRGFLSLHVPFSVNAVRTCVLRIGNLLKEVDSCTLNYRLILALQKVLALLHIFCSRLAARKGPQGAAQSNRSSAAELSTVPAGAWRHPPAKWAGTATVAWNVIRATLTTYRASLASQQVQNLDYLQAISGEELAKLPACIRQLLCGVPVTGTKTPPGFPALIEPKFGDSKSLSPHKTVAPAPRSKAKSAPMWQDLVTIRHRLDAICRDNPAAELHEVHTTLPMYICGDSGKVRDIADTILEERCQAYQEACCPRMKKISWRTAINLPSNFEEHLTNVLKVTAKEQADIGSLLLDTGKAGGETSHGGAKDSNVLKEMKESRDVCGTADLKFTWWRPSSVGLQYNTNDETPTILQFVINQLRNAQQPPLSGSGSSDDEVVLLFSSSREPQDEPIPGSGYKRIGLGCRFFSRYQLKSLAARARAVQNPATTRSDSTSTSDAHMYAAEPMTAQDAARARLYEEMSNAFGIPATLSTVPMNDDTLEALLGFIDIGTCGEVTHRKLKLWLLHALMFNKP